MKEGRAKFDGVQYMKYIGFFVHLCIYYDSIKEFTR
jgi:hypothetical protein